MDNPVLPVFAVRVPSRAPDRGQPVNNRFPQSVPGCPGGNDAMAVGNHCQPARPAWPGLVPWCPSSADPSSRPQRSRLPALPCATDPAPPWVPRSGFRPSRTRKPSRAVRPSSRRIRRCRHGPGLKSPVIRPGIRQRLPPDVPIVRRPGHGLLPVPMHEVLGNDPVGRRVARRGR